jgi:hypothetical protein
MRCVPDRYCSERVDTPRFAKNARRRLNVGRASFPTFAQRTREHGTLRTLI